jgi:hypothetical protein
MRTFLFAGLLFLIMPFTGLGQDTQKSDIPTKATVSQSDTSNTDTAKPPPDTAASPDPTTPAPPTGYVRPDSKTRLKRYVNSMIGPWTLARTVARSGIGTWQNSPEEWGDHWDGFGRRVASSLAKNAIKQTTVYGLDSALRYDSHFYRSTKKDFGSRITNALLSPVTARNVEGKRVIGIPRIVGAYSSSIIAAETWYPKRFTWKDGLKDGTVSIGFNALFALFEEFFWKK